MNASRPLADQAGDLQALLASGFGELHASRFILLTIRDVPRAREWLRQLLASGHVKSAAAVGAGGGPRGAPVDEVVSVAFSHDGLRVLGVQQRDDAPFPTPYTSGMGSDRREALLRDTPRSAWTWSDVAHGARQCVHILIAHWWRVGATSELPLLDSAVFGVAGIDGCPSYFRGGRLFEPFGFRDGLSQPLIRGLRSEGGARQKAARDDAGEYYDDRLIAAGEFILGQPNEYGEPASAPNVRDWRESRAGSADTDAAFGVNGAYLAVRQIEQDVRGFERLTRVPAGTAGDGTASLAEKLMGRRRDDHGTPLGWRGAQCPVSDSQADAFRYARDDADGFDCPRGAHVRRANPRDALGHDVPAGIESSKLHRLLRRGRPYRAVRDGQAREGLFFIACNADLERQFEFVQQRWLRNARFADLEAEDDPLLGAATGAARRFTVPGEPSGLPHTLADYTTTLGGGYFFLPGLRALAFVAGGLFRGGE